MKKKLLFVNSNIGVGGAEKSLFTLLTMVDRQQYDLDLFLLSHGGEWLRSLPQDVHLLELSEDTKAFLQPLFPAVRALLRRRRPDLAWARFRLARAVRTRGTQRMRLQNGWRFLRKAFVPLPQEYDAAVAYLEGTPTYFCADLVRAKRKIAYFHSDYRKLQMDPAFDEAYLRQFDSIVAVSDACADVLREVFPALSSRVRVIENIIAPELLRSSAQQDQGFDDGYTGTRLLTIGRLESPKGIDIALDACALLADRYDFRWYVIGDGVQQTMLENKIREKHMEDRFILMGLRLNPYPYLSQCDVYVQPSRFEGKSIALEEAKAFRKPIVTTAFTTVANQITDGVNGSVAQIDAASIADKVDELLRDASLRERYSRQLQDYTGNVTELETFYSLLA